MLGATYVPSTLTRARWPHLGRGIGEEKKVEPHYAFPWIDRTKQEIIDLLLEARSSARAIHERGQTVPSSPRQIFINYEAMCMIFRLARIMAWIMERKATMSSGNSPKRDEKDGQSLGENALCMVETATPARSCPLNCGRF